MALTPRSRNLLGRSECWRRARLGRDRGDAEGDLGDTGLLQQVDDVDDPAVLHFRVGLDDRAKLTVFAAGFSGQTENAFVALELALVHHGLAVRIELDGEN